MTMIGKGLVVVALILFTMPGCAISNGEEETMYQLAAPLTKLSAAVESAVRYKNASPNLSDDELIDLATRHDKSLLTPFVGYRVRARADGRHGIVMVCTREGERGLLEDIGCTAKLDRHLWQEVPARPCRFTITARSACPSN